jgi:proteasome alpha subunit
VTMPFYTSPEQLMRERSELARKGIARGRSVVVLKYAGGVLFVAENPSTTLHKVSEIYDRIGFAAVGRYSEFENLRMGGIRMADVRGYAYDRRDVTGRALANTFAQTLGAIFTEQVKPFEVEICVAEVGSTAETDQLYRLTYDGSIVDEPQYVVMGGQAETITSMLKDSFSEGLELGAAIELAVGVLSSGGEGSRELGVGQLEVAVLERSRPNRTFRRISGAALQALLPGAKADSESGASDTQSNGGS